MLDQKDLNILATASLRPTTPINQLQKILGYKSHTIRYVIHKALESKLIQPHCFVNLNLLGFNQYEIYFTISSTNSVIRNNLLKYFDSNNSISWVGEVGGDYHYGMNICTKSVMEVSRVLDEISELSNNSIFNKDVVIRVSLDYFGISNLQNFGKKSKKLMHSYSSDLKRAVIEIDETDKLILKSVMESPLDKKIISKKIKMPLSTLEYRIKKLESQGIIVGYYYSMDLSRIGMQAFLFLIGVNGNLSEIYKKLLNYCIDEKNISVLIRTIGSWDFEIAIDVKDAKEAQFSAHKLFDFMGKELKFLKVLPLFAYKKVKEYPF